MLMHDLQVFGYRIDDFAYLTDVKTIEDIEIDKLRAKVLVVNAFEKKTQYSFQFGRRFYLCIS
jgi:phosphoribosyl 1,2-cyclic phosphate phosphodiesterase